MQASNTLKGKVKWNAQGTTTVSSKTQHFEKSRKTNLPSKMKRDPFTSLVHNIDFL